MRAQFFIVTRLAAAVLASMPGLSWAQAPLLRNNVAGNRDVPGFDSPPITVGAFVISPSARLSLDAESNIFRSDFVRRADQSAILAARVKVSADIRRLALRGFLDGRITRYRRFSQNDADEYAMQLAPLYRIDDASSVSFAVSDRRVAEQRGGVSLSLLGFDREVYREPKVELSGTLAGGGLRLNASLAQAKRR